MLKLFEKYNDLTDIKDKILSKAVESENKDIVDFLLNKGYKITQDTIVEASYTDLFKHILSRINLENYMSNDEPWLRMLKDVDNQKILIDMGYESLLFSSVGFNHKLENDPKYKDIIDNIKNMDKYNI